MCIICVELAKANMTFREVNRNLEELSQFAKSDDEYNHYVEVSTELEWKEYEHINAGGSIDDIIPINE